MPSPAGRRRAWTIGIVAAVCVVFAAGQWWAAGHRFTLEGAGSDALVVVDDVVELPALEPDTTVWRSLVIENTDRAEATITAVEPVDLSAELEQVDVRIYDVQDTDGFYTSWYVGAGAPEDEPTAMPSKPLERWNLPPLGPGETVTDYLMVELRIAEDAAPGAYRIDRFRVRYETDGRVHEKDLPNALIVNVG